MRNSMIDTVIVSGGNIGRDFALDFLNNLKKETAPQKLCLIAADKGLEFFMETGLVPDTAVGDFDSLSECGKQYLSRLQNVEIRRLKPEKDDSDTQSALNYAIGRGAKGILILGATGTRIDHLLANLGLLTLGKEKGVHVVLADSHNYISLVESGTVLKKSEQFGGFVSFFAVSGQVEGLTLEGFKYPLHGHHLIPSDSGLTVSNEIKEEEARVTYTKGSLLMIMSRD